MTDHDDVLAELDAALKVEPSRAFADGVRARVNRSEINTRRMWLGLAAAASVGLATMALWRPSVEAPAPAMVSAAPTQTSAPVTPKAPEAVVTAQRALVAPGPMVRREVAVVRAAVTTGADEPRLEVITNQGAVLRALWADYRGRPLVMAEGESLVEGISTKPITVNPIVVPPIVVAEIGKEPGPAGATPIIRRTNATRETR